MASPARQRRAMQLVIRAALLLAAAVLLADNASLRRRLKLSATRLNHPAAGSGGAVQFGSSGERKSDGSWVTDSDRTANAASSLSEGLPGSSGESGAVELSAAAAQKLGGKLAADADQSSPSIPKVLHQSWKDSNIPARFLKWQVAQGQVASVCV